MNNTMLYTLTVLIWGSTWYAITFQLGEVHPVVSVGYRFMLASCVLFAFLKLFKKNPTFQFSYRQHKFIALQGLFLFSLNYVLFYFGTSFLTSGLVAILFSTMTLMNIFNQALFFKIKIKKQVLLGSLIGLVGILLVFWPEVTGIQLGDDIVQGIILCLVASYFASLGNMVSMKNSRDKIPVMESNAYGMLYGAGFSLLLAIMMGASFTFEITYGYTLSMIYLAIFGSAIAFGCYLTLIKNIGADKAAYTAILFPLVALTISTIFENYTWTQLSVCGVILTLFGNVIAMKAPKRSKITRIQQSFDIVPSSQLQENLRKP
ncbi:MAG: EamA family transporter [Zetaproteobacteria bacterium]|nr:MAG: EamA family transporter [Zetaproteobacteria bacterium]